MTAKKRKPKKKPQVGIVFPMPPDERTAGALERIVELIEETRAEAKAAKGPPPDLTQVRLDKTLTEGKHACPYCTSSPVTLYMRGNTVFGCSQCIPSFVGDMFRLNETFIDNKVNEGWVSGMKHAEAIVRLALSELVLDDATRTEIADALQKEATKHERKGNVHAASK